MDASKRCLHCGADIPRDLETCAAIFEQCLAQEYADAAYGAVHLLSVDAYVLQHSEEHGPRSNAFHLMRLCLLLEHGGDPRIGAGPPRAKAKAFEQRYRKFPFLAPPPRRGESTVADVYGAQNPEEHSERVRRWAKSVWGAWGPHHAWARETGRCYAVV